MPNAADSAAIAIEAGGSSSGGGGCLHCGETMGEHAVGTVRNVLCADCLTDQCQQASVLGHLPQSHLLARMQYITAVRPCRSHCNRRLETVLRLHAGSAATAPAEHRRAGARCDCGLHTHQRARAAHGVGHHRCGGSPVRAAAKAVALRSCCAELLDVGNAAISPARLVYLACRWLRHSCWARAPLTQVSPDLASLLASPLSSALAACAASDRRPRDRPDPHCCHRRRHCRRPFPSTIATACSVPSRPLRLAWYLTHAATNGAASNRRALQ